MRGYEELERWVELRNAVFPDDPDSVHVFAVLAWALSPRIEGCLPSRGFCVLDESVTLRGPLL